MRTCAYMGRCGLTGLTARVRAAPGGLLCKNRAGLHRGHPGPGVALKAAMGSVPSSASQPPRPHSSPSVHETETRIAPWVESTSYKSSCLQGFLPEVPELAALQCAGGYEGSSLGRI